MRNELEYDYSVVAEAIPGFSATYSLQEFVEIRLAS